jgi:prolyl-tRNA editing enzyme YbaK/EbsC (Cys-tRNA(Pro) deacylase)
MFSFLRRPKQATDEVNATQFSTSTISFDPSGIIRAITFHLLDEGKAHAVNPESSEATMHKLSQRINHLTISADQWSRAFSWSRGRKSPSGS